MTTRLRPVMLLPVLMLATWLAYLPGLSAGFLFDDFPNLAGLGDVARHDFAGNLRFLTSGTADPLGRPISLLSFLANAQDWPANPAGFLKFNLALHLLNGGLLFVLLSVLGGFVAKDRRSTEWAALVGAGAWLLHPLFVSTTLYAVQREAMLPASFVLAGLIAYCHGKRSFLASGGRRGLGWMIGGIALGTALAALSKANGLLLPLLAWTLEATVLDTGAKGGLGRKAQSRLAWSRILLLKAPGLAVLAYACKPLLLGHSALANRPWTIVERVLTEPRILFDYLGLLALPRSVSTGLYNDGYAYSTGILQPASTALALAGLVALLAVAVSLRKRLPALSAALLFFLAGHVLESGAIPLELYFEHRNYLPALLLFWPIGLALSRWQVAAWKPALVAVGLLACLAVTTAQRARLWGDPERMAAVSVLTNPQSARAQTTAAFFDAAHGQAPRALARLDRAWSDRPTDPQIGIAYIRIACSTTGVRPDDIERMGKTLASAQTGLRFVSPWLTKLLELSSRGGCPGLGSEGIERWLAAAAANPKAASPAFRDAEFKPVQARIALLAHQPQPALALFNQALAAKPAPGIATQQATELAAAGYVAEGIMHLDYFDSLPPRPATGMGMARLHAQVLAWQHYWPGEVASLRAKLKAELAQPDPPTAIEQSR